MKARLLAMAMQRSATMSRMHKVPSTSVEAIAGELDAGHGLMRATP
jgi:hypothetical protein